MKDFTSSFSAYKNNSRNVVLSSSKVLVVIFIPLRVKGTCQSLSGLLSNHLRQKTSMLSSCRWMERDFRELFTCALFCLSRFSGVFGSKTVSPHNSLFCIFLGHIGKDTDFVFVLHSVRTSASCPFKRLLSASKTVKTCRSTWPFLNFLFLLDSTERISRGTHSELPFDEVESERILEILDSIGCSQRFSVK